MSKKGKKSTVVAVNSGQPVRKKVGSCSKVALVPAVAVVLLAAVAFERQRGRVDDSGTAALEEPIQNAQETGRAREQRQQEQEQQRAQEQQLEDRFEREFDRAQEMTRALCNEKNDEASLRKAVAQLQTALKLAPPSHQWLGHVYYYLGQCLSFTSDDMDSRRYYGMLLDLLSKESHQEGAGQLLYATHANLARSYLGQKVTNWTQMLVHAEAAAQANPTDPEAHFVHCLALIRAEGAPTQKTLARVEGLVSTKGLPTPSHVVRLGQALANASLPTATAKATTRWPLAHEYLMRGQDLFPSDAYIRYITGRTAQLYGDGERSVIVKKVLHNLRESQKIGIRAFRQKLRAHAERMPKQLRVRCGERAEEDALAQIDWRPTATNRRTGSGTVELSWASSELSSGSSRSWPHGRELPFLWKGRPASEFKRLWGSLRYSEERRVFYATLRDVWIVGSDGVVLDKGCRLYATSHDEEIRWYELERSIRVLTGLSGQEPVQIPESISLLQLWSTQVYHFSVEGMCRLHMLRHIWEIDRSVQILVPTDAKGRLLPFIEGWLAIMGVEESQVGLVHSHPQAAVFVRKLHVADWRHVKGGKDHWQVVRDTGRLMHYLPPAPVVASHAAFLNRGRERGPSPVLLFVSRGGTSARQFADEPRLKRLVHDFLRAKAPHFRMHVFGDDPSPPFSEIRALFEASSIVLGVHGAGLGNIIFSQPGTDVVELATRQPHGHYFAYLSTALDLRYWWMPMSVANGHAQLLVTWNEREVLGILQEILLSDEKMNLRADATAVSELPHAYVPEEGA